jgi:hypothetical protein
MLVIGELKLSEAVPILRLSKDPYACSDYARSASAKARSRLF